MDPSHIQMEYKKLFGIIMILLVETNIFPSHPGNSGEEKIAYKEKAKEIHIFTENP